MKILIEMRPAFEAFAGIPQEVRLLFRGLNTLLGTDVFGLLQHGGRTLARGTSRKKERRALTTDERFKRYSNVVISTNNMVAERPFARSIAYLQRRLKSTTLLLRQFIGRDHIQLTDFKSAGFEDFNWRTLFAKTLPPADFADLASRDHLVCRTPWRVMHQVGIYSLNFRRIARYPKLVTDGFDVMIGQTPYPGRVSAGTALVVRYHDAVPLFMPHTIPEQVLHQAQHYNALRANVQQGAWFSCVSEATRADLIRAFPDAEPRAVTIHNMVSHNYFTEPRRPERVHEIIRSRLYERSGWLPTFSDAGTKSKFYRSQIGETSPQYLLMVSTIEPRKNHARLISAWEALRAGHDADLKLVIVGTLGWNNDLIRDQLVPWLERGDAFLLNNVPAADLRCLYANARATVCPSYGEGFDYSGVEAMASGGVTVASDIPVHREVYGDAALFFDPYSTAALTGQLEKLLYRPGADARRSDMETAGQEIAARYTPEQILPQWESFLRRVTAR
ncbi:glycosyltransferase family 4 protein [Pacificimonas sp. WHA3]|uniref:Glycosyltransferase family 4 protein n=1 Tax=Pacificimonas pallii TaxID=2827236 RepID=A0ABS6SBC8_9SPHN|nr:glycosyltransferase family 1 protein [Pacificimonas pallii]MBV7255719.1 glycosyltransferase family 4 protein [Pacificimonas pallii]